MNSNFMLNPSPRFHVAHLSTEEFDVQGRLWAQQCTQQTALRFVRGDKMRTYESLFSEFAAAFQFPYYFGKNWPAFSECLSDLAWVPASAYLLMLTNAAEIYKDEHLAEYPTLLKILSKVSAEWAKPISGQGGWDRPAKPFHCVFQCDGSHSIEERLKKAGIDYDSL